MKWHDDELNELRGALFFGCWDYILRKYSDTPQGANAMKTIYYVFSFGDIRAMINEVIVHFKYDKTQVLDNIVRLSIVMAEMAVEQKEETQIIQSIKNPIPWLKK